MADMTVPSPILAGMQTVHDAAKEVADTAGEHMRVTGAAVASARKVLQAAVLADAAAHVDAAKANALLDAADLATNGSSVPVSRLIGYGVGAAVVAAAVIAAIHYLV